MTKYPLFSGASLLTLEGGLMKKNCILVYSAHIKKTNNHYQSCMAGYKRVFAGSMLVCLAFAVVFSSVVPSEAGTVYGHVSLDGGSFPPQGVLTFLDARGNRFTTIRTDQNGNYNVFLPPGVYNVTFTRGGATWSTRIRSYPNAVKQDIRMRR